MNTLPSGSEPSGPASEPDEAASITDHYEAAFQSTFAGIMREPAGRLGAPPNAHKLQLIAALAELQIARAVRFGSIAKAMAHDTDLLRNESGASAYLNLKYAAIVAGEAASIASILRWTEEQDEEMARLGQEILDRASDAGALRGKRPDLR